MMKTLITAFLVLCGSVFSSPEQIHWMDYDQAIAHAREDSLFVLVEVYAEWCGPCHEMAKTTFVDSAVIRSWNESFAAVTLNVESDQVISCNNWPRPVSACVLENWKLEGVPSFVLIGPSGNYILSVSQALDAGQMLQLLQDLRDNRITLLASDRKGKDVPHDP